jgi:hypothetical protein
VWAGLSSGGEVRRKRNSFAAESIIGMLEGADVRLSQTLTLWACIYRSEIRGKTAVMGQENFLGLVGQIGARNS